MSLTNPHPHSLSLFAILMVFDETSLSLFLPRRKVSRRTSDLTTSTQPGARSHRLDDTITEPFPTPRPNQEVDIYFRCHYNISKYLLVELSIDINRTAFENQGMIH